MCPSPLPLSTAPHLPTGARPSPPLLIYRAACQGGKNPHSRPLSAPPLRRLLRKKKKKKKREQKIARGALELKEMDGRGSTFSFVEAQPTNKGTRRKLVVTSSSSSPHQQQR